MKVAIVGAGWSGMAAAVELCASGHHAIVFEASKSIGGRARAIKGLLPTGADVVLDNGQHILIGAYSECLKLMQQIGITRKEALVDVPLSLTYHDGSGLEFANLPAPLDALGGILLARGWSLKDKYSLLTAAIGWQRRGFQCPADLSVGQLCAKLTPRLIEDMIEPLCVSALNTPASQASAQVFLKVIQDALFGSSGGSRLLLPRVDLSSLFPQSAATWLQARGGDVRIGDRVLRLQQMQGQWQVHGELFDAVVIATSSTEAMNILMQSSSIAIDSIAKKMDFWVESVKHLEFQGIATVYAWAPDARLAKPMISLRSHPENAPAQFVFDRGQLGGPAGLLAFVVSACNSERQWLTQQVLNQAQMQLGLELTPVQTVVEKRATFSCTPGLQRPAQEVCLQVWVAGDYTAGPYPATLEGAVRSGLFSARSLIENARRPFDRSGIN